MYLGMKGSSTTDEGMEVKAPEDVHENVEEDMEQPPDWLPDGWIMEVKRGEDGTRYQYFVSPVSGCKFRMKAEVLNYLFSEMDEYWIQSKESAARGNMLPKKHEWLPKGWLVEIRAGGEKMDKMFKFYVHPAMGVRVLSKEDVLLYVKEMKITECDTDGQCDTNSRDNILAEVEFNPSDLPEGWVKEIVYRKTKKGTRKDPYYTDPVSQYVFRTRRAALRFLDTGKVTNHQFIQKTSVHDVYSFEKSADLHESLSKRLTKHGKDVKTPTSSPKPSGSALWGKKKCNGQTSYDTEDTETDSSTDSVSYEHQNIRNNNKKTKMGQPSYPETSKRPRGRPPKVAKAKGWNMKKHESLSKRITKKGRNAKTPTSSPKPRGSALWGKKNCNGQTSYDTEDTETDSSTDSVSDEHQNIRNKSETSKRPRGRPPKVQNQTDGTSRRLGRKEKSNNILAN